MAIEYNLQNIIKGIKVYIDFKILKVKVTSIVRVGTHGRLRYDHSELTGRAYGP